MGTALLFLLLLPSSPAFAEKLVCKESLVDDPPFYVSGVADKTSERFVMGDHVPVTVAGVGRQGGSKSEEVSAGPIYAERDKKSYSMLSRGSLVRAANVDQAQSENALIQVKVMDLNTKYEKFYPDDVHMAHEGEIGYLNAHALKKTTDQDVFMVKHDLPLAHFGGLGELPKGTFLKLLMQGNQYKSVRCGDQVSYLFSVFDPSKNNFEQTLAISDAALTCLDASGVESLTNFKNQLQLEKYLQKYYPSAPTLSALQVNDWGLTRMPMKDMDNDPVFSRIAFDGSFAHYQGGDPVGTDDWIEPQAACSFLRIMGDWKKSCGSQKKCLVQMGDSSFITPALAENKDRDPLGHLTHYNGHCVDVRIFRKDAQYAGLNIVSNPQDYDQELTKKFIQFLLKSGATPIYFNDKSIDNDPSLGEPNQECDLSDPLKDKGKKVKHCEGHDNHIHFCLYPDQTKGCG